MHTYVGTFPPSEDTITYDIECWDPGNKWFEQDVFNLMGEALEQIFTVFKSKSDNQQYKLDVLEKIKDTFPIKLKITILYILLY